MPLGRSKQEASGGGGKWRQEQDEGKEATGGKRNQQEREQEEATGGNGR